MLDSDGAKTTDPQEPSSASDRRRFERVEVDLPGRYMLEDGAEFPCRCLDISVSGVRLQATASGPWGSRVIAYIEGIGRIEGYIVRRAVGWFALEVQASARKGERVQERMRWMLDAADEVKGRRPPRQFTRRDVSLEAGDGKIRPAQLTDISKDGAALLTESLYEVGERLRLDHRDARVVRSFPGGVALAFDHEERRARS